MSTKDISKRRGYAVKYHRKLKWIALCHYNIGPFGDEIPECACCGEMEFEFLTIHHLNNDGAAHRREPDMRRGAYMYQWLKNNNYPEGFGVLCLNCNFAIGHYGYCPHSAMERAIKWKFLTPPSL